jgi:hypothetical protein
MSRVNPVPQLRLGRVHLFFYLREPFGRERRCQASQFIFELLP